MQCSAVQYIVYQYDGDTEQDHEGAEEVSEEEEGGQEDTGQGDPQVPDQFLRDHLVRLPVAVLLQAEPQAPGQSGHLVSLANWSSCHLATWPSGKLANCPSGHLATWHLGRLSSLATWHVPGYLAILATWPIGT